MASKKNIQIFAFRAHAPWRKKEQKITSLTRNLPSYLISSDHMKTQYFNSSESPHLRYLLISVYTENVCVARKIKDELNYYCKIENMHALSDRISTPNLAVSLLGLAVHTSVANKRKD